MEQERDVIVVGAGPAGAMTATILAQQGRDVLLLDRNDFPRDKICGDGIPAGAFRRLYRHGMREKFDAAYDLLGEPPHRGRAGGGFPH